MKRWAALTAAVLCLAASAPAPPPVPANFDAFGITLLQRLASPANGNVFISPLSIGIALSMAADGANGETRTAILRTLQQPERQNLADSNAALIHKTLTNPDARVGLADAIWLRAADPPLPSYMHLMRDKYAAEARAVRFGDPRATAEINNWVSAHTLGLISHLIDATHPEDFAYLTNALAFQAKWTLPFTKEATQPHRFTNGDGTTTTVKMMTRVGIFATTQARGYRELRASYGRGGFAAYIILPDHNSAQSLLKTLTRQRLDSDRRALRPQYIRFSMPRFIAGFKSGLNDSLSALGMGIAFSRNADFTRMHLPRELFIADVKHASYVRVDEAGTTAAAATSVEFALKAISLFPPRPPIFVADHPFIFVIRDERTGALLFIGVLNRL
jgi:serpin B